MLQTGAVILQPFSAKAKTYSLITPMSGMQSVTCQQIRCAKYTNGWVTRLLEGDGGMGDKLAYMVRHSGRKYTEVRDVDGFTVFTFEAGQMCFQGQAGQHKQRRPDAPEFYVVQNGRSRPVQHRRVADWIDDFANHQLMVADRRKRG
jgi:hypothetical protein